MFKWLSYRRKLYRLNRRERKLSKQGEALFEESQKTNDSVLLDNWLDDGAQREYEDISWERKKLVTRSLLNEADLLHLPRPSYGEKDKWQIDVREESTGTVSSEVLTPEAMLDLRSLIRKEKKETRETVEWWVKIIVGVITIGTGLVGALIGLVSILKHK